MKYKYNLKQEQVDLFEEYKESHIEKVIPNGLSKEKRKKWLEDNWLGLEGEELIISGGGRVLLWLAYTDGGLRKHFEKQIKKRNWKNAFEVLQFIFREDLLGVKLERRITKENARRLINDGEIILNSEEVKARHSSQA